MVTRIHAVYDWHRPLTALLGVILMEFGDFAMLRRMLRGIKARAESLAAEPSKVSERDGALGGGPDRGPDAERDLSQ